MGAVLPYRAQMKQIRQKFGRKTFAEFEQQNNIQCYSYAEVGYGYRLKESQPADKAEATEDLLATPLLDELAASEA